MKEKDNIKPEMENVIRALANAVDEKYEEEYKEKYKNTLDIFCKDISNWDNAEALYYGLVFPLNDAISRKCINENPNLSKRAVFVITNYSTFNSILEGMTDMGHGCRADMARWILKEYIKKLSNPDYVIPEITERNYYIPEFGTAQDWLEMADCIFTMIHTGNTENFSKKHNYLMSLKKDAQLIEQKKRESIKKYSGQFKAHIERLRDEKKITKAQYDYCFTYLGSAVIWNFVDMFMEDKYNISDEELIAVIKKEYKL